jgi:hypothetical protein
LTNESTYTYFIDNQQTSGHQSIVFGLRELNSTETTDLCSITSINTNPPITNQRSNFTSDYELRIYTSGCYYLDTNNNWQSDGLRVRLVFFCVYVSSKMYPLRGEAVSWIVCYTEREKMTLRGTQTTHLLLFEQMS